MTFPTTTKIINERLGDARLRRDPRLVAALRAIAADIAEVFCVEVDAAEPIEGDTEGNEAIGAVKALVAVADTLDPGVTT